MALTKPRPVTINIIKLNTVVGTQIVKLPKHAANGEVTEVSLKTEDDKFR